MIVTENNSKPIRIGVRPPSHQTVGESASTSDVRVTVETNSSYVTNRVYGAGLQIGGLSLLAVTVAVVLALIQARRLARPMQELARAADRLGSGAARPLGRRYGIQELDRVAEGLDGSAQRITDLLSAERDFAIDASHQLRTPLTALSMRLEEMIAAADYPDVVREEGAAALAQTERLTDVVSQLLGQAGRSIAGAPALASVDEIVAQQVVEWEPAFPPGQPEAGGHRRQGPVRLRDAGRGVPGHRDAAGQRAGARSGRGDHQDVQDPALGGDRGPGRGHRRAAGAGTQDLRAQRERIAGRDRAGPGCWPARGRRGRWPGGAGAAAAGRVRAVPAARHGRPAGPAGGERPGLSGLA